MVYNSCPLLTFQSLPSQFQSSSGFDLFLFIGVYLIYYAVLISGVHQRESVICIHISTLLGFPDSSVGKESTYNTRDPSLIPGLARSPGERIGYPLQYSWASLMAQMVKNLPAMWGDQGSIPGSGKSSGGGHDYPLLYSCLENPRGQRSLVGHKESVMTEN